MSIFINKKYIIGIFLLLLMIFLGMQKSKSYAAEPIYNTSQNVESDVVSTTAIPKAGEVAGIGNASLQANVPSSSAVTLMPDNQLDKTTVPPTNIHNASGNSLTLTGSKAVIHMQETAK